MTSLFNFLLTSILNYGYPVIVFSIILSAFAIPIPTSTLLIAGGSFSVNSDLNFYILILISTITSIFGDSIGYCIGRKYGHKIKIKEIKINNYIIFFSRWILLPLGVPVNILSGATKFKYTNFLTMVILGEILWSTLYVYLGYLFGANWQSIASILSSAPLILTLAILGIGSLMYVYKIKFSKTISK